MNVIGILNKLQLPEHQRCIFTGIPMTGLAFLLFLTTLIYLPSLDAPFIFDDVVTVLRNPTVIQGTVLSNLSLSPMARSLTDASYALNVRMAGWSVHGFHTGNILIHLFNVVLVVFLCRRLGLSYWVAVTTAAVFAVHPVQTESVTYITGRAEILAATFVLLGLIAFYCERAYKWLFICLFTLLAFMAKPTGIYLPVYISGLMLLRYGVLYTVPMLSLGVVTSLWLTVHLHMPYDISSLMHWFGLQSVMVYRYVLMFVYPRQSIDWGWMSANYWQMAAAGLGLLVISGLILFKRRSIPAVASLLFLGVFIPRSSLITSDALVEHRMYLPLLGLALLTALVLEHLWSRNLVLAAVIPLLMIATVQRNDLWRSEQSLWHDAIIKAPNNPRAHINYGREIHRNGNKLQAIVEYQTAASLAARRPDLMGLDLLVTAQTNLATAVLELGDLDRAVYIYKATLSLAPHYGPAVLMLARILNQQQRYTEVINILDPMLLVGAGPGFISMSGIYYEKAVALCGLGLIDMANEHFNKAETLIPSTHRWVCETKPKSLSTSL